MTSDPIPQQAGPGEGADQLPDGEPLEALRRIYSHAMFGDRGNPNRMWRLLHAEVRALAVEDSRERCASEEAKHVEGFLCRAWGESDKTAAALCGDMAAVRQFLIDEWLGDESSPDWEGNPILPGVMDELAAYSWADEGNVWQTAFEIGGLSIERVTFQGCELATDATKTA